MRTRAPNGHYYFETLQHNIITGYGDADYVRLRDEHGNVWQGSAEIQDDETVRYRFRDAKGKVISGISDCSGILLRDDKGHTWRGYVL
jgi:hypothetical protein